MSWCRSRRCLTLFNWHKLPKHNERVFVACSSKLRVESTWSRSQVSCRRGQSTQTRTLGRRLFSHNVFWKQTILTKQPLKAFKKPFNFTWPLRKQPSNLWMLLVRLQSFGIFCFQKTLWLYNLLPTVPASLRSVRTTCLRSVLVLV